MNDMPVPPKKFDRDGGKWNLILEAVAQGKTVYVPGVETSQAVPSVNRGWIRQQGFRVASRVHRSGGSVIWLERKR